jgi:hypothetical protein
MLYSPTDIMRQFLFVREAAPNKGAWVEAFQRIGNGKPGDSWCCFIATAVLEICFQGKSPIPRLGACQDVYNLAKKNGWLVATPQKDDIYLFVNSDDHAHHIGFITDNSNSGIAGNTSADGTSSNGDRVAEHTISTNPKTVKYVRFPR